MNSLRRRVMASKNGGSDIEGAIDLGLPSGIKWATCNLGASTPEAAGLYFSWGNVVGHAAGSGYSFSRSRYQSTTGYNLSTDIPNDSTYDAAVAELGSGWRVPSESNFQELYDNTDKEWITDYDGTGVKGWLFKNKSDANKSIFLPAAGYYDGTTLNNSNSPCRYWSATQYNSSNAYRFYSNSGQTPTYNGNTSKYYGFTIRAVYDPSL